MLALRAVFVGLALLAAMVPSARTAEPGTTAQRLFPAKGLVAYVEFDGLRVHANAWEATAAYAMLAKTPAGAMMNDLAVQVTDRFLKLIPDSTLTGAELIALQDHLVREGFAIGLHRHGDEIDSWTIVVNGAGRKGSRERIERFLHLAFAPAPPRQLNPTRLRGRDVYQLKARVGANGGAVPQPLEPVPLGPAGLADPVAPAPQPEPPAPEVPWLSWWFEKDDLVLISVPQPTFSQMQDPATTKRISRIPSAQLGAVLDALDSKLPNVTTHPGYAAASSEGKDIKGFESDGLFFIETGQKGGLLGLLQQRSSVSQLELPGLPSLPHGSGLPQQFAGGYATPAIPTPDGAIPMAPATVPPAYEVAPSTGAATGRGRRDSPGVASRPSTHPARIPAADATSWRRASGSATCPV